MENPTTNVNAAGVEKSPEEIEREMLQTRESITEKVAALESQVFGNLHSVTSGVTEAVQSVKEAVATAPNAVSDTVKQTVAAVKETVRETVGSFSVTGCVRDNPLAALGTTTVAGFLAGYFFGGSSRGGVFSRPLMARGDDVPVSAGRTAPTQPAYTAPSPSREPAAPGLFDGLLDVVGKQVRDLAEQALTTAMASLKQSMQTHIPQVVDTAVTNVTERVASVVEPHHGNGTSRVSGPTYSASAPPI